MIKKIVIGLMLIAFAVAIYFIQDSPKPERSITAPAAEPSANPPQRVAFELSDLSGEKRKLSDWDGKARLVNFWATWCAPCRREIPLLKKTQAEHGENSLQVIGIAVDFPEEVEAYAEEAEFNYPILVGQEDAMEAAEASGVEFIGLPFTMVLSQDGDLIKTHIGEIVEDHIDKILAVLGRLESGEMDLATARKSLENL